jgi:hypothetical protein
MSKRPLVLPDERTVGELVARATRRARTLAIAEAAAWGAAAGALSLWVAPIAAIAVGAWRWRSTMRASIVRGLERAQPDVRNLFVTAEELQRDALDAKPAVRARVFADAANRARHVDLSSAFPASNGARAVAVASGVWMIVFAVAVWRGPVASTGRLFPRAGGSQKSATPAAQLGVTALIDPPSYTGVTSTTLTDPPQIQAIEGSDVTLTVVSRADRVTLDHDGDARPLSRDAAGRFTGRLHLTKTGFVVLTTDAGARRLMPIVVSPDARPSVHLAAPGRDLVYAGGNPRITFTARATDDYGLRSLALRYTKVSGSDEQFEFKEGEIPLAITPANARDWSGTASAALADLNLKDGDMLVYRAVASDARPGDGSASSDVFFIEISKLGLAASDGFTVPEEETRYALSQQMLIVKTERLDKQRTAMTQDALAEAAMNLSVEQRMIRAEFVFMLGGEIEDEDVEAEQSNELQEGRLQNRGQRDVRAATVAMSQAQKLLTAADTANALVAERAAVVALQRAFSRDRYILRALATRAPLDLTRRLTGNMTGAADWRRTPPDTPANRTIARLEDLLSGIAALMRDAGAADATAFRSQALVLAEEALRIDAGSEALRQAAAELQRAADAGDRSVRVRATMAATAAVAKDARAAHAGPATLAPAIAPALSGAFSDAVPKP